MGLLLLFVACHTAQGQAPTAPRPIAGQDKGKKIVILDNELGEYVQTDSVTVHKLLHHVKLLHGSDTLFCDSAFFYTQSNSVEAFGNVIVEQADGTEAYADYMRYTGGNRTVYMRSNSPMVDVRIYDGKENTLYSRELDYNLDTKIGRYHDRGYLESGYTVVQSNEAIYDMKTKEARFKGDVSVSDPEYKVRSVDLGYNTASDLVRIFGPSVVVNDQSVLHARKGTYDAPRKEAFFYDRASIWNDGSYVEGDSLYYDRAQGLARALGQVVAYDTAMKAAMNGNQAHYNERTKWMLVFGRPILKMEEKGESRYLRADTFMSAPDTFKVAMTAQDSLQYTAQQLKNAKEAQQESADSLSDYKSDRDTGDARAQLMPESSYDQIDSISLIPPVDEEEEARSLAIDSVTVLGAKKEPEIKGLKERFDAMVYKRKATDSLAHNHGDTLTERPERAGEGPAAADTSLPRYFVGIGHVLIYSDSLQGKCDSIRYSELDSTIRMFKDPLLWPKDAQLKGDMIYILLDSSKLKELYVPYNAIMVSRSGPEKAQMFDQIQGNHIKAYFRNNAMDSLIAEPNAASIYYIRDDDSAYVGCSQATGERIEVWFEGEGIDKIYYRKDVEQKTTPMMEVEPAEMRLARFSWEEEKRPKTLEDFLEGDSWKEPDLEALYPDWFRPYLLYWDKE